jgi:hypothetical protein
MARAADAQQGEYVQGGHDDAGPQRDAEQQLERDGRPQELGQIRRGDRDFGRQPQRYAPARVGIATRFGEVLARRDAHSHAETLQEHADQRGGEHHPEEPVAVSRARGEIGRPVAGIEIADGDQRPGARERPHSTPQRPGRRAREVAAMD